MNNKEIMVVFVGNRQLGLYLAHVREIFSVKKIIEVPGSKSFVKGVVNYRGNVIPVINLKSMLNMPDVEYKEEVLEYTIIAEYNDNVIGIMVDKIKGIFEIENNIIEKQKIPEMTDMNKRFISSIVEIDKQRVLIMDMENIVSV